VILTGLVVKMIGGPHLATTYSITKAEYKDMALGVTEML
jgi:hypothetical protein